MTILLSSGVDRKFLGRTALSFVLGACLLNTMVPHALAQTRVMPEMTEAEDQPKSILFPAGVPGPYFPSDEEIAQAAEERLSQNPQNSDVQTGEVLVPEDELVVVSELDNGDGSAYGTIGQRESGLAKTIWQPSEFEKIEKLLGALNLPSTSPVMDDIARKLLLAVATAPTGEPLLEEQQSSLFSGEEDENVRRDQPAAFDEKLLKAFINLRLKKLIERGNLVDLVSYIQNLPEGTMEPEQQNAEILMLGGDLIGACQMTQDARRASTERETQINRFSAQTETEPDTENIFWLKMVAFCRILEGNNQGAQIAIDMLNEQGNIDFVFSDLLGRLMENPETRGSFLSRGLTSLEPLNYTILSLLDQTIDADLIENSSPLITSALVINPNMPPENRFQAAVKSYESGGVSAELLRNIYGLREFTDTEYNNAVRMAEYDARPVADALLYQAASKQTNDFEKAQVLEAIWKRALENNDLPRKAALNVDTLKSLTPASRLFNHAHHIARGLILAGETDRAVEWYNFVRRNAASGDAEATRALINVWPLIILATDRGEIPWSENILDLWWNGQMVLAPENRDSKAALFYAAAEAFDYPVSDIKWEELITENRSNKVRSIPLAVWREMIKSVGENKQAQSIILGLIAMGKDGPGSLDPSGISTIIRMLRSFGMEKEARKVAIEALVTNDF